MTSLTSTERHQAIRLLDALPDLGAELDRDERERARRHLVVAVKVLERGRLSDLSAGERGSAHLGMLIVEGLLVRDVVLGETVASELVGRGDLLRPLDHDGESAPVPFGVNWTVLRAARIAILDHRVGAMVCHWPPIAAAIVRCAVQRSHNLALHVAMCHLRRVDARVLVLLWHLADRWGHVTREGVEVPVKLTHETVGRLIGAQRPSVTTALRQLAEAGLVSRKGDSGWLLHGEPPEELANMRDRASGRRGEGAMEPSGVADGG